MKSVKNLWPLQIREVSWSFHYCADFWKYEKYVSLPYVCEEYLSHWELWKIYYHPLNNDNFYPSRMVNSLRNNLCISLFLNVEDLRSTQTVHTKNTWNTNSTNTTQNNKRHIHSNKSTQQRFWQVISPSSTNF